MLVFKQLHDRRTPILQQIVHFARSQETGEKTAIKSGREKANGSWTTITINHHQLRDDKDSHSLTSATRLTRRRVDFQSVLKRQTILKATFYNLYLTH